MKKTKSPSGSPTGTYTSFVTGGKAVLNTKDGQFYRQRRGAVTVVVEGTTLKVGWSLCNYKSGDRFSAEQAQNLAEGRARNQHSNSLKFSKTEAPTTADLIDSGVPQSVLSAMGEAITEALSRHSGIRSIQIFNSKPKPSTSTTPKVLWNSVAAKV